MALRKIQKSIFHMIRAYRVNHVTKLLDSRCKSILDIGCQDFYLFDKLKDDFEVVLADIDPKHESIRKENIESLSFDDKSFDTVLCLEVLEHTHDPLSALKELIRVTRKDLIISVPNEPFFSLFRLLLWEKEHLWAITPSVLKHYLGEPAFERKLFLRRYYLAKWSL